MTGSVRGGGGSRVPYDDQESKDPRASVQGGLGLRGAEHVKLKGIQKL